MIQDLAKNISRLIHFGKTSMNKDSDLDNSGQIDFEKNKF